MQIKTQDGTFDVGSNGKVNAALTTGIIGTVGAALGGGLGNFLGGGNQARSCEDTRLISALESKIAKLESEKYTDSVGTGVYAELNKKYNELAQFIAAQDKANAVAEAVNAERLNCLSGRVAQLEALTKLVVPNASVCPGWGNVTITPATTTAG